MKTYREIEYESFSVDYYPLEPLNKWPDKSTTSYAVLIKLYILQKYVLDLQYMTLIYQIFPFTFSISNTQKHLNALLKSYLFVNYYRRILTRDEDPDP